MRLPLWNSITPRRRKLIFRIGLALLIYAIIGFLILPPIVRRVAQKQISAQLDRETTIEQVKINPFALSATIRGLLIRDRDGQPFVSWDEVYANFQLSSLIRKAWTFKEVSTTRPFVRVQLNKDGSFNFSDLIAKFSTNAPAEKNPAPAKPLLLNIDRLQISGAVAALADFSPRQPFKRTLGPLDITLDNFATHPDNKNPYAFTGTTDAGERIAWSGYFYLDPLRSAGELKLFNFSLNKYAALYQDLTKFELRGGSVAMTTKYRVELSATNRVAKVEDTSVALRDLAVGASGETNNLAELALVSVNGASADLQGHTAHVNGITVADGKIFLSRNHDAQINLVELAKPNSQAAPPEGILFLLRSVTNAVAMLLNTTNDWRASLGEVNVTNVSAHLEDWVNSRPARLALDNISFVAKHISNVPGTNVEAELALNWNTNGSIRLKATAAFYPPTADARLDLDAIDFHSLDPYLEPKLDLFVLDSKLDLHGTVHLRTPHGELPEVTFRGDTALRDFHTVDGVMSEDLLKWDAVKLSGLEANLNPPTVGIRQIDVDGVYARVVVETNRSINLMNVLRLTNSATIPVTNALAAKADTTNSPAATFPMPKVTVGAIVLSNATLSFSDHSLPSDVNLAMKEVNGTISDLSSEQLQHANVDISGKADGVGPFSVTGKINPFSQSLTNTIKIALKNMDLTPMSAYSGKFAGYRIAQGKLNLDLDYALVGTTLNSKNVITLDRFRFGETVESPDATHLPVKLAVSILKDRNGQIVLDVPIEGDLKDPQLRISKVVWRAVENILVKVATSPFSLLGAVFGGNAEELGYQEFTPGSAELSKANMEKLEALAKSLADRPALGLEISGSVDAEADRDGLRRAAIDRMIKQRVWQRMSKSEQARTNLEDIIVIPSKRPRWLEKFYNEAVEKKLITAELLAANTNLASLASALAPRRDSLKGAEQLAHAAALEKEKSKAGASYHSKLVPPPSPTEAILMTTIPVSNDDLRSLADARARVVQDYFLNQCKLDPFRLFLKESDSGSLRKEGCRAFIEFR